MSDLRIEPAADDAAMEDWRHVHNTIIPTVALSLEEVRERVGRHLLEVAYADDLLVGCSTVRPPAGEAAVATVIARVLAEHRRQGFGRELYERGLARARDQAAEVIETIVLASNEDGLRFALAHGFVEVERYLLPGDEVPFVTLRLHESA